MIKNQRLFKIVISVILIGVLLSGCSIKNEVILEAPILRIGYSGGNLPAVLYSAQDDSEFLSKYQVERLDALSTVGYGLLSGYLDVGFVDVEKLLSLSKLEGFENLVSVGKITYPYGATLILRKGLNKRLTELDGLTLAVSSPNCKLLKAFETDAERFGADLTNVTYTTLAFDAMIPALEAGIVDGVIIKGFYSVIALKEGHTILYQNWDVIPGDEHCPAIVDQAILILLAHKDHIEAAQVLADRLAQSQAQEQEVLRKAIANYTTIPYDVLTGQPVPEFSIEEHSIIGIILEALEEHENDDDDDDDENETESTSN